MRRFILAAPVLLLMAGGCADGDGSPTGIDGVRIEPVILSYEVGPDIGAIVTSPDPALATAELEEALQAETGIDWYQETARVTREILEEGPDVVEIRENHAYLVPVYAREVPIADPGFSFSERVLRQLEEMGTPYRLVRQCMEHDLTFTVALNRSGPVMARVTSCYIELEPGTRAPVPLFP